ncbi:MAG: FxsA family protein [Magnetococcales bacterium]|nr:FxsA family protein [Magnetococcales bacterium]
MLKLFMLGILAAMAVELYLLIQVGDVIGALPTLLVIIGTAMMGLSLARREGVRTLSRAQARLARGEIPGGELADGVLVLVAAVLLVIPGFISDVIGFLLIFPVSRYLIKAVLRQFIGQGSLLSAALFAGSGAASGTTGAGSGADQPFPWPDQPKWNDQGGPVQPRGSSTIEGEFQRESEVPPNPERPEDHDGPGRLPGA